MRTDQARDKHRLSRIPLLFHNLSKAAASLVILIGLVGLTGWIFNLPALTKIYPTFVEMKFNTALLFAFLGAALWVARDDRRRQIERTLGLVVVVVAGLTLAEYALGANFGIDQLVLPDASVAAHPGRMSVETALCFLLIGLAVACIGSQRAVALQRGGVAVALAASVVSLCGYFYGVPSLYSIPPFSVMAEHTALGFAAASLSYFLACSSEGTMYIAASRSDAGFLLRTLIPIVFIMPVVLGWLMLEGQRFKLYDAQFGTALLVLANIACLTFLTMLIARSLFHTEGQKQQAEQWLRKSEQKFSTLFRESPLAIALTRAKDDRYVEVNETFERMTGLRHEELTGPLAREIALTLDAGQRSRALQRVLSGERVRNLEIGVRTKAGETRTVLMSAGLVEILGEPCVLSVFADITDLKKAEEARQISEHRFSQFFTILPEYCYIISPDGTILDVNDATCKAFGYEKEELVGKAVSIVYAPESQSRLPGLFEKWRKTGSLRDEEMVVLTKEGEKRTVILQVGSVKDSHGKLLHSASIQVDITERKQMEQKLRESQQRLNGIIASAMDAIITIDDERRIVMFNAAAENMFGYTETEVTGRRVDVLMPERYRAAHGTYISRFGETGAAARTMSGMGSLFGVRKSGEEFPIEASISQTTAEAKQLFTVIIRDITARLQAENALRESEQRFRLVANTAPVMIWMSGADQLCSYFNQPWLEFTGRPLEAELGNGWLEGVHLDDLERRLNVYTKAFDHQEAFQMEYRLRRHDGEYRWILDSGVPRLRPDGSFEGFIGSCVDVTERKLAEEALSRVSQKLIEAHEEERTRIARELHDDINSRLALLAVKLDVLRQEVPASATKLRKEIGETSEDLQDLGGDIQALSHRLHSSRLEYLGLEKAATSFCNELSSRQGVTIEFHSENVPKGLPTELSLCFFRVLQEALQNAVRYSGSRDFQVSLVGGLQSLELKVSDLGVGFDPEEAMKGHGLGLTSMRERMKLIGGVLHIDSKPLQGTTIRAIAPLAPKAKSAGVAA